jgi:hypothetical protein
MGGPFSGNFNFYEYSGDMSHLKATISKMEKLVTSLNAFHDQTHALDTKHQDQLVDFRNTLLALFEGNESFQGPAADALKDLVSHYLQREQTFVGTPGDTSPQFASATQYCVTTSNSIEQELQTLYKEADAYAYKLDVARSTSYVERAAIRIFDPTYPSEEDIAAPCPLPPSASHRVSTMEHDMFQWENNMDSLGSSPPPVLPPAPSIHNISFPPGTILDMQPLSPDQQRWVQDLLNKYQYPGASQADIENLVRLGYSEIDIEAMLKGGFTHDQLNAVITRTQAALVNGTDSYGLSVSDLHTMFVKVATALNSSDKNIQLEGQVALLVLGDLISFHREVVDPTTGKEITDIDVETPYAFIEVTNAQQGKAQQLDTQRTNPYVNPSGKPVILFAPRYKPAGVTYMKNSGIPYAKTFEQLKQLLEEMFGEK